MLDRAHGEVSESFMKLQRLRRSFDEVDSLGRLEIQNLKHLAQELGAACVRLCVRELGQSSQRSRWASALLEHLAQHDPYRVRVLDALRGLALEAAPSDPARMRASSLLVSLGERLPPGISLDHASASTEHSMADLAERLGTAAGVAWAGDLLVTRLPPHEMLGYLEGLCERQPAAAYALLSELLLRDDLDDAGRRAIKRLRAARDQREHVCGPLRRRPVATVSVGRHASGKRALVAWRKRDPGADHLPPGVAPNGRRGRRGSAYRVLCLIADADGSLQDGLYRDDMARGGAEHEVLEPLRKQGYQFETMSRVDAVRLVVRAARLAWHAERGLPRAFYLGRDLLDIYDQHTIGLAPPDDLPALLERARALLADQDAERARPLFERYVAQNPDDADGRAGLSMCLLELGDDRGALTHLHRAAWLQPDNPNHHWNLAAIAHRQGRLGGCYLALNDYLAHSGEDDDAPGNARARRALAERFVAEYQRIATLEYPTADPDDVADVDEIVLRAWRCVRARECEQALGALLHALERVPEHYPALSCLGIACIELGRLDQAREHLTRALSLRPGFPLAVRALERVEERMRGTHDPEAALEAALLGDPKTDFESWLVGASEWTL